MIKIELEIPDEVLDAAMDWLTDDPEIPNHALAALSMTGSFEDTLGEVLREAVIPLMR